MSADGAHSAGHGGLDLIGRGWTPFRRWPWWGQALLWLAAPIPLWLYVGSRPRDARRNWVWVAVVVTLVYGAMVLITNLAPADETEPAKATQTLTTSEQRAAPRPTTTQPPETSLQATTAPPTTSAPRPPGEVTAADYGDAWPFTVDSGTIRCIDDSVVFVTGGTVYAINGIARTRAADENWTDIFESDIWAANPDIPDAKLNIGPIIDDGLALC